MQKRVKEHWGREYISNTEEDVRRGNEEFCGVYRKCDEVTGKRAR